MTLREKVDALNAMILQGQILDAFEKFYAEDVVMQDNTKPPRIGKDANREFETQFVNGLTAFRGAEIKGVAVEAEDDNNGIAFIEWYMDFTHSAWGDLIQQQVAVQRWKDGQIVHERFYHNTY